MKLQSRILQVIVTVALVPLLVLVGLFYLSYRTDLTNTVLANLDSVAAIQQSRMNAVLRQNEERLALVSSRTQLRISLDRYLQQGNPAEQDRMTRILADAALSIADIEGICVYSPQGIAVAATDSFLIGEPHFDQDLFARSLQGAVVDRLYLDDTGQPRVHLTGPMTWDGRIIGAIVIRARVQNLLASLGDFAGLGETGETVLFRPVAGGNCVFLAPTRFDPKASLREFAWNGPAGEDSGAAVLPMPRTTVDYRNQKVLSAWRRVPNTDWLLEVKIDRDEAFRTLGHTFALAMSLLVIVLAVVGLVANRLAQRLSAPLAELSAAAGGIASGDFSAQVPVRSQDEVGVLVGAFNHMAGEVARSQVQLRNKITELNGEIAERQALEAHREELIAELRQAMSEIKSLRGIIPICSSCKKIRDDQGYWNQLESYISDHSEAEFTHGICPDCYRILAAEIEDEPPQAD